MPAAQPGGDARRAGGAVGGRRRAGPGRTVFDRDWRPGFWPGGAAEARSPYREELAHATVAVGNVAECEVATGARGAHACAQAALVAAGVTLAVVKRGPDGVLAAHRDGRTAEVAPHRVRVVNGLGAGDAFGGALCHGLLAGWDPYRTARYANAAGALVASRLACSPAMPFPHEVEALLRRTRRTARAGRAERSGPARGGAEGGRPVSGRVRPGVGARPAARGHRGGRGRARAPPAAGRARAGLLIIAADHPARGALAAGGRELAMADRRDLLERLLLALSRPGVDGVLGTADVLEDLLLLGALENRVALGSMNRGGLAGLVNEFDDRFTGHTAAALEALGADGGKMLTRICLGRTRTPSATLEATAKAIDSLAERKLIAMVEPFLSVRENGKVRNDLSTNAVIKSVAIAEGLGSTSAYTWMKLPVVAEMERVMASTTMPTVLLGGDPEGSQDDVFASWQAALALPGVQGLTVGRTLLYPHDGDVAGAVATAASLLHRTASPAPQKYRSNFPWE